MPSLPLTFAKEVVRPWRDAMALAAHRARWRIANQHNHTTAVNMFPLDKVTVGAHTYGPLNLHFFAHADETIHIGSLCSIADDVHILAGGEHPTDRPTSFPLQFFLADQSGMGSAPRGPVVIGDDVWIGRRVLILSGVTIGQGAVIGAGSVVAKDVPPYAIYAGGRVVRYRFDDQTRAAMEKVDWGTISPAELQENLAMLCAPVDTHFLESALYEKATIERPDQA